MENIINEILEIDQKAREKLEKAQEQKKTILREAEKAEENIKCDILVRANNRVDKVEEFEKAHCDEKIEAVKKSTDETIALLNKTFDESHNDWENLIYNNIIE